MADRINVLVTSVGGGSHGSSIVKALLTSTVPMNIVGADMSPLMIKTSPLNATEVLPRAEAPEYLETIVKIIEKYAIDCVFTGSEQELIKVISFKSELESHGVKVFMNNEQVIRACKNKLACNELLSKLGFDPPRTTLVKNAEDLAKVDFFPAVIKPYLVTGASANVFVTRDKEELSSVAAYLLNKRIDIIAQEYLPYEDNEYTVGVTSLLDQTKVVSSIALKKFIEGLTRFFNQDGIIISSGISQGRFDDFPAVRHVCESISAAIGSTGPLNIQLRVVDGKIKPFEINPRFSGTTSARAFNGYNEPEFFIRKYVLSDPDAKDSLDNSKKGFIVKGLDEKYFKA